MLDYKSIGRKISFYRRKNKITQAKLAEAMDVSDGYISQLENGKAKISLLRLDFIAEYLGVDIAVFLSDKVVVSHTCMCTEINEIIKDWSKEEKTMLAKLLACYDSQKNNTEECQ